MKPQVMSADDFKAELKRLGLGQSAFAQAADVPLRTVQSWALGERRIPSSARLLIENVQQMPLKEKVAAGIAALPDEKRKAVLDLIRIMGGLSNQIKALEEQYEQQASDLAKMKADLERLRGTCVFQAEKISAYEQDVSRRAANAVPFNV